MDNTRIEKTVRAAVRAPRRSSGQRGMTLMEIMIVLAILALVMGFLIGPRVMSAFSDAKEDTAYMMVRKFAHEAYPQWAANNPTEGCPSSMSDLSKYMNDDDTKDPWGSELIMLCGDNLPEGAKGGLGVMSLGPDKKQGTGDDIKSWEKPKK